MINDALATKLLIFSDPQLQAQYPMLPLFFLREVVHLCVSDVNKMFLIKVEAENAALKTVTLTGFLIEALFLDPKHGRCGLDVAIKTAIQRDAAECFLQIALFEPGREMLTKGPALEALRALTSGQALSEECKVFANGAILAVEGVTHEPAPAGEGDDDADGHVMVS